MKTIAFAVSLALFAGNAIAGTSAVRGVSNPPNIPVPSNPAGWCTSTLLVPGTTKTTQIGDCPQAPPTSCPAGRIVSTVLSLRYDGIGRKSMDVTKADNILGYNDWSGPRAEFPWKQGYTIFWGIPRTPGAYIAAEFVVPNNTPTNQWGKLYNTETIPGPGTDWALSKQCGDFSPAAQYCASSNVITGRLYGNYKVPGAPIAAACELRPGERWYMMFRLSNPSAGGQNCNATTCQVGVQNNHNP